MPGVRSHQRAGREIQPCLGCQRDQRMRGPHEWERISPEILRGIAHDDRSAGRDLYGARELVRHAPALPHAGRGLAIRHGLDRDIGTHAPQLTMVREFDAGELLDRRGHITRRDRRKAFVVAARVDVGAPLVRGCDRWNIRIGPQPLAPGDLEDIDLAAEGGNDAYARRAALQLGEPELHWPFTYRASSTVTPRVANTRATASPILLFGVLAPAVSPRRTGRSNGSQPGVSISSCAPAGRWRMVPRSTSRQ